MLNSLSAEELSRYELFERGSVPCIFLIQVAEGFCRFNVTRRESLELLLDYCRSKGYRVEWTAGVLKGSSEAELYRGYPGGKYIAHTGYVPPQTDGLLLESLSDDESS